MRSIIHVGITASLLCGCTFVDLTAQGEKVRVLQANEVAHCQYVGKTTSETTAEVAGVRRHPNAINFELKALARNGAQNLGGDTVVADAPENNGRQVFSVYRCIAH